MKKFMDQDFLLSTESAKELFHNYAEKMPIFDCHTHLPPKDIAEHRRFRNLTELWLEDDNYKWRAMRAYGVGEELITGAGDDYDKFMAWAEVLPKLVGSPLYHWTHLELQRYFGITRILNPETAKGIFDETSVMLKEGPLDAISLLKRMNVKTLCTTDDPADDLEWHRIIEKDDTIPFKVLPAFRPDKYIVGSEESIRENCAALCGKYGTGDLKEALSKSLDFFCSRGCVISDHGLDNFPYGEDGRFTDIMDFLGRQYAARGVVMQLHLGAIRDKSPRLLKLVGSPAGGDSVGVTVDPAALAQFLGKLEREGALPRTILYNCNPNDNPVLATMAGTFAPYVRFGAAWWFNDHRRGMQAQISELMETGSLACSVGMLTDSRSLTSFVRHEYYRRILCERLGELVENGMYPDNIEFLGSVVKDICYNNAVEFFTGGKN